MPADLIFREGLDPSLPADLVFGASGGGVGPGNAQMTISVTLGGITSAVQLRFNNAVDRGVRSGVDVPYQAADRVEAHAASRFDQAARARVAHTATWREARRRAAVISAPWITLDRADLAADVPWERARQTAASATSFAYLFGRRTQRPLIDVPWREAQRSGGGPYAMPWVNLTRRPLQADVPWEQGVLTAQACTAGFARAGWLVASRVVPWEQGIAPGPGRRPPPVIPPPHVCYHPALPADLLFQTPLDPALPADLIFVCDGHGGTDPELPPALIVIPIQRVYVMINTADLIVVASGRSVPTLSISLSLDVDSWTWGFSASVPGSALPDLEPAAPGEPVELEARINGHAYRVLAEQLARDRSFGQSALRVQGRGLGAMLDAPYAPTVTLSNPVARTAQQLMVDALTVNGVPLGWDIDWDLTDWLVPAGAWSFQGSYIGAITRIAQAAGAYVRPHPTERRLRIMHRYPIMPWDWPVATPDIEAPVDVTVRESIEWLDKPTYNRVFVSGEGSGVLAQVTRAGTAGDAVAPMIVDPLTTHADAGRQRGAVVLADTGPQAPVTLRMPVLPSAGILEVGQLLRYVDGSTVRVGLVRSVSVEARLPEVWQTVGMEAHL